MVFKYRHHLGDCLFAACVLSAAYFLNLMIQEVFDIQTLIPMIFVLGVFLISLKTQGYFWGITSSLISVLMVNYTFTYPYYAIRLTQTEYNILAFLASHAGKVMTYSAIIKKIWGASDDGSIKKLQVNMANIRRKLGIKPGDNRYFINELGVGYRMNE